MQINPLLFFALINALNLITPGPNFFFILRTTVKISKKTAVCGMLGITTGVMCWLCMVLLGVVHCLQQKPWITQTLYLTGGVYLSWLGMQLFRNAKAEKLSNILTTAESSQPIGLIKSYSQGLLTDLSNPQTLFYWLSLVATVYHSAEMTASHLWGITAIALLEEVLWLSFIIFIFSRDAVHRVYLRYTPWIDRCVGIAFLGFALRLLIKFFKS